MSGFERRVFVEDFGAEDDGDHQEQESRDLQHQLAQYAGEAREHRTAAREQTGQHPLAVLRRQQSEGGSETRAGGCHGGGRLVLCCLIGHGLILPNLRFARGDEGHKVKHGSRKAK